MTKRAAIEAIKEKGLEPMRVALAAGVSIAAIYKKNLSTYDVMDRIAAVIGEPMEVVFDIDRKSPLPKFGKYFK